MKDKKNLFLQKIKKKYFFLQREGWLLKFSRKPKVFFFYIFCRYYHNYIATLWFYLNGSINFLVAKPGFKST